MRPASSKYRRRDFQPYRVLVGVGIILFQLTSLGQLPAAEPNSAGTDAATIDRLIRDLDSDQYGLRQQATRQLYQLGPSAIEPLREVAIAGSLEQAARAVRVLKQLHQSDDATVHAAAQQALELIRRSPRRAIARRAAEALESNAHWRRNRDPAVVAAAHWSEVRAEATQQIERSQLEVRDTMNLVRRQSAAGLSATDDPELVESLRAATRRLGEARLNLVRGAIHGREMTNAEEMTNAK